MTTIKEEKEISFASGMLFSTILCVFLSILIEDLLVVMLGLTLSGMLYSIRRYYKWVYKKGK